MPEPSFQFLDRSPHGPSSGSSGPDPRRARRDRFLVGGAILLVAVAGWLATVPSRQAEPPPPARATVEVPPPPDGLDLMPARLVVGRFQSPVKRAAEAAARYRRILVERAREPLAFGVRVGDRFPAPESGLVPVYRTRDTAGTEVYLARRRADGVAMTLTVVDGLIVDAAPLTAEQTRALESASP